MAPRRRHEIDHWEAIRQLGDETPEGRVEVGPTEDRIGPLSLMNRLSQVRQEYDPHAQDELTEAMIIHEDDGSQRIQLIQPVTVGYFHKDDLEVYIDKLNATWGASHTVDELSPIPGSRGRYYLLVVAGHRRTISIPQAAERIGVDPELIDVVFHVVHGNEMTFREGIRMQYRENAHLQQESWQDAIAINAFYAEGLRSGEYRAYADCARDLGVSTERVATAYRFNELPEAVQGMVEKGVLQYGAVAPIYDLALTMAFRDGKDAYTKEQLQRFFTQYDQGRAMLTEALTYLDASEREAWERELVNTHLMSKELRGKTIAGIQKQVDTLKKDYLKGRGQTEHSFATSTQADLDRKNRLQEAALLRNVLKGALQEMIRVFESEGTRVRNGRRPVLGEELTPRLLGNVHVALKGVETLAGELHNISNPDLEARLEAAISTGRLALAEVEAYIAAAPDPMTEATQGSLLD